MGIKAPYPPSPYPPKGPYEPLKGSFGVYLGPIKPSFLGIPIMISEEV